MSETNGFVKWKIFIWVVGITTIILGGVVSMAVSALSKTQDNTLEIMHCKTNEENHYSELKGVLNEVKIDVKEILKTNK